VPRFILERFAKDGALDLVERADLTKVIRSSVRNALLMKDFYTFETDEGPDTSVETLLATHVEGPAAEAFRRLVDGGRSVVAPGIRDPISLFIAFQYLRGRASREMLVEFSKAQMRQVLSMATPEMVLRSARERGEEMSEEVAADTAEYARSGDYTLQMNYEANLHLGTILKPALTVAEMLLKRSWRLLNFREPSLVTCDEPVGLVGKDPRGPGNAGGIAGAREIVFPVDPHHALLLIHADRGVEEGTYPAGAKQAEIVNLHVAFRAHRFIVRRPETDPLRGVVLPNRAPSVVVVGNGAVGKGSVALIGMEPNATEDQRARTVAKMRGKLRQDARAEKKKKKGVR
jgi:hypothetical protein